MVEAVLNALHGLAENARPAAALVADDLIAFDANQRGHVAELAHPLRALVGDEMAIGEYLEVAIGMLGEHVEQMRVHERLAADDAEEDVAHRLGLDDELVHGVGLDDLLLGRHVYPAALTAQVAAVDDRDIKERREDLAPLQAPLVLLD